MAFPSLRYERHGSRTSLAVKQKSDHFKLQLQKNLYQPVFVNWYCKRSDFAAPVTLWENVCPWLWLSFCPAKKLYFDQPKLQGSDYVEKEQPVSVKTNMFKTILWLGLLTTNPSSRKIIVFVFSWICICPTLTKVEGVWAGRLGTAALAPVPLICVIYWQFVGFVYFCSLHGICICGFVIIGPESDHWLCLSVTP